jgi:hypothetical protein
MEMKMTLPSSFPPPLPPSSGNIDLEQRFLAALREAKTAVESFGLNRGGLGSRNAGPAIAQLAEVFDEVIRHQHEDAGDTPASVVVVDEDITLGTLTELAGGDEPVSLPSSVLRRLLDLAEPGETGQITPATVDVFVDGLRCQQAAGRTASNAYRWLQVDLPGKGVIEVLLKPRREGAAG